MTGGPATTSISSTTARQVIELAGGGNDTINIRSATTSSEVENLTLTGAAAINGTGNALDNTIIGNAADNTLNGGGGDDMLMGGLGDDTYVVEMPATSSPSSPARAPTRS